MTSQFKALGFAFGFIVACVSAAPAAELKLMTGPQGGAWVPLGGDRKSVV